jgi:hemoglobin-like flavoprotein
MKAEQLELVIDSLTVIQPIADQIAKSFYKHLFEIAPQTKKLFTGDMERQGIMLMTSLSLAVNGLSDMENTLPAVQALGERHYSYGVKPEYYQPAVESFLWSLEYHLGDQFTPDLKESWRIAFQALADTMLSVYNSQ